MAISPDETKLAAALHERGQRVTPQRLVIHRTLRQLNRHVGAEELLGAGEEGIPGVSPPPVYSTLELLEGLGLVRRVGPAGGRVLYDSRLDDHHHVVCSHCGRVEDIDAPLDTGAAPDAAR